MDSRSALPVSRIQRGIINEANFLIFVISAKASFAGKTEIRLFTDSSKGIIMEKKTYDIEGFVKGGPYSHVVEAGGFFFLSGQVPIDLEKKLFITDDIIKATELVLNNIKRTLETVGSSMDQVVKTTVFLRDMADFEKMNQIYTTFFTEKPPARSCVAVKELPGNFPVEIELVAIK